MSMTVKEKRRKRKKKSGVASLFRESIGSSPQFQDETLTLYLGWRGGSDRCLSLSALSFPPFYSGLSPATQRLSSLQQNPDSDDEDFTSRFDSDDLVKTSKKMGQFF